jgi:zinc transporter, ZIP family
MPPIISILLLSLVASLGTGLGGLLVLIRKPGKRSFGFLMGITAGVMISLSFLELVNEAWQLGGPWTATLGFGAGALFMFLLDFYIPTSALAKPRPTQRLTEKPVLVSRSSIMAGTVMAA